VLLHETQPDKTFWGFCISGRRSLDFWRIFTFLDLDNMNGFISGRVWTWTLHRHALALGWFYDKPSATCSITTVRAKSYTIIHVRVGLHEDQPFNRQRTFVFIVWNLIIVFLTDIAFCSEKIRSNANHTCCHEFYVMKWRPCKGKSQCCRRK